MSSVSAQLLAARLFAGLALVAVIAPSARADTVLAFSTPSCAQGINGVEIGKSVVPYTSNGFKIVPASSLGSWCSTTTAFAGPAAFINAFGETAALSSVGGSLFGITSIDLAGLFAGNAFSGPLVFTGHVLGGATVQQTFNVVFGATTPPVFSTFSFASSFQNLTSLDFATQGINGERSYQFTNIHLTSATTTTPEPGTLFLAATGFAALAVARRRKRR